jgi:hypothetical protein
MFKQAGYMFLKFFHLGTILDIHCKYPALGIANEKLPLPLIENDHSQLSTR